MDKTLRTRNVESLYAELCKFTLKEKCSVTLLPSNLQKKDFLGKIVVKW